MKKFFDEVSDSMGSELISGLAIAVCLIMLFSVGFLTGGVTTPAKQEESAVVSVPSVTQPTAPSTTAPQIEATTAPSVESTPEAETTAPVTEAPEADTGKEEAKSTAEIVALFNESANKVKTNATKVVKNYEYRTVDKDKLVVPAALQSMAESLMDQFMQDDLEPVEYATAEDITANFMVPEQPYVSKLTEADVAEADCTDNGTEYEITIRVNDETNPTAGSGVGSVFDVIEASEVSEFSFVKSFVTEYSNCVVKCRIDKATGNMVHANYTTPLLLNASVNMFGTHEASVGLTFEKDYDIYY